MAHNFPSTLTRFRTFNLNKRKFSTTTSLLEADGAVPSIIQEEEDGGGGSMTRGGAGEGAPMGATDAGMEGDPITDLPVARRADSQENPATVRPVVRRTDSPERRTVLVLAMTIDMPRTATIATARMDVTATMITTTNTMALRAGLKASPPSASGLRSSSRTAQNLSLTRVRACSLSPKATSSTIPRPSSIFRIRNSSTTVSTVKAIRRSGQSAEAAIRDRTIAMGRTTRLHPRRLRPRPRLNRKSPSVSRRPAKRKMATRPPSQ
mmetsp:Transcript_27162/g.64492  ORF Transcript_27162/g.64492 Transcript_27162/m.64492 type:complete len:265 (-) Transcript_27162:518-1312(-)